MAGGRGKEGEKDGAGRVGRGVGGWGVGGERCDYAAAEAQVEGVKVSSRGLWARRLAAAR